MSNQVYSIRIKCDQCNKNINHGNVVVKNKKQLHYLCYKKGKNNA